MQISLPADLSEFVKQLVESGKYSSPEEVVAEALRRLQRHDREFVELKASLDEAIAELERGEGTPFDVEEIKRKDREILAGRRRS